MLRTPEVPVCQIYMESLPAHSAVFKGVKRGASGSQEACMAAAPRTAVAPPSAAGSYSESRFWSVLTRAVAAVGAAALRPALELYFIMKSPQTPIWAKATALGALGYLILPIDLIPDALPGIGWTDDITVMLSALRALRKHNTTVTQEQARAAAERFMYGVASRRARNPTMRPLVAGQTGNQCSPS
jgi:uncharacterized membrane protein YkvA (DUF1232 family)